MKRFVIALSAACVCLSAASVAAADTKMMMGPSPAEMKWMATMGPKHPLGLPADAQPVLGCIPTMGYHYANPNDLPFGPIYGWYDGKPTFTEIMVDTKLFASGKSWSNQLKPLPGYKVDHVDFWFEKHGHPGYPIPHYDIHAWYIPSST
jgi:hypothetical protein